MTNRLHRYTVELDWIGNRGTGTSAYRDYGREIVVRASGKLHQISSSSDRAFHGDADRWNPEELLLASLAECHLLSYLYVATARKIVVLEYTDSAYGELLFEPDGSGRFASATLHPRITIARGTLTDALDVHGEASKKCFIRASVNFPVYLEPQVFLAKT